MTDTITNDRLTVFEADSANTHQTLLGIEIRLTVLEQTTEKGFHSVGAQLSSLRQWLEERL